MRIRPPTAPARTNFERMPESRKDTKFEKGLLQYNNWGIDRRRQIVYENHLLLKKIIGIDLQKTKSLVPGTTKRIQRGPGSVRSLHYWRKKRESAVISQSNAVFSASSAGLDHIEETVDGTVELQRGKTEAGLPQTPDVERHDFTLLRYRPEDHRGSSRHAKSLFHEPAGDVGPTHGGAGEEHTESAQPARPAEAADRRSDNESQAGLRPSRHQSLCLRKVGGTLPVGPDSEFATRTGEPGCGQQSDVRVRTIRQRYSFIHY